MNRSGTSSTLIRRRAHFGILMLAATEEPLERADGEPCAGLHLHVLGELGQGDVPPILDRRQNQGRMRLDPVRAAVAALRPRRGRACAPPARHPADRRALADLLALLPPAAGRSRLDRPDLPPTNILGIGSCQACWPPPPAHRLTHEPAVRGIPSESVRSGNAIGRGLITRQARCGLQRA